MILAVATMVVLVMVAVGLVLFHRLARFLEYEDTGPQLLLLGILPGLALVGLLVTGLGLVHLFYGWALAVAAVAVFGLLWRDTRAIIAAVRQSLQVIVTAARGGDLFPVLALLAGGAIAATLGYEVLFSISLVLLAAALLMLLTVVEEPRHRIARD